MLASGYFKFLLLLFSCASELFLLLFVVTVCKLRTSLSRHMHTYSTRPQNFFWRLMKGNVFYNYLSVNWIGLNNKIWIKKKRQQNFFWRLRKRKRIDISLLTRTMWSGKWQWMAVSQVVIQIHLLCVTVFQLFLHFYLNLSAFLKLNF